jgi:restriction system protein
MSRRQLQIFRASVLIASRIPAYVSLPAGTLAYILLHIYCADRGHLMPVAGRPADAAVVTSIIYGAAMIGQYAIPILLGLGACAWIMDWNKHRKLRKLARRASDGGIMAALTWQQFEQVVAQAFVSRGYDVEFTPAGADGGVDLILKRNGGTYLVQCKHWKANQVGVEIVRSLHGVMTKRRATGGYVVTSGSFTRDARLYCEGENIWIITGEQLRGLLAAGGAHGAGWLKFIPEANLGPSSMFCPHCQSRMVLRVARRGANSGSRFWGCSNWPDCDAKVSLAGD